MLFQLFTNVQSQLLANLAMNATGYFVALFFIPVGLLFIQLQVMFIIISTVVKLKPYIQNKQIFIILLSLLMLSLLMFILFLSLPKSLSSLCIHIRNF